MYCKFAAFVFICIQFNIIDSFAQPYKTAWVRSYGSNSGWDGAYNAIQTQDGGFIVIGHTDISSNQDDRDGWVLKTNSLGDTIWTYIFGGIGNDEGYAILETEDSSFILTGTYRNQGDLGLFLAKIDNNGEIIWSHTYGRNLSFIGQGLCKTYDGNYLVIGTGSGSATTGSSDIWLLCFNDDGDTLFTKTYSGDSRDEASSIIQTSDSGYAIIGATGNRNFTLYDFFFLHLDRNYDITWTKRFSSGDVNRGSSLKNTLDGGYILFGWTRHDYRRQWWLIKTDSLGDSLWSKNYIGKQGTDVIPTQDSGFIIVGDGIIIGTNSYGDSIWSIYPGTDLDFIWSCNLTKEKGLILSGGSMHASQDNGNVVIAKLDNLSTAIKNHPKQTLPIQDNFQISSVYNNNFKVTSIGHSESYSINIFNAQGKKIKSYGNMRNTTVVNLNSVPAGIYFFIIRSQGIMWQRKLLIIE